MKFITYFIFLNSFIAFSQIKNGVITYGVVKSEIDLYSKSENNFLIQSEKEAREVASLLNFKMIFNKEESCFVLEDVILSDGKDIMMALINLQVNSRLFSNVSKKINRRYINNTRVGEVVEIEPVMYEWTITKETKEIDGYTCYKATSPLFTDGKKSEDSKLNVVAWFAPKIPVPYGPNGYGGLPGLILELQKYVSTIYVKSINLNVSPEPEMERLEEYPQLTRKEVHEYMMSSMTPEQKKAVLDSKRINEK